MNKSGARLYFQPPALQTTYSSNIIITEQLFKSRNITLTLLCCNQLINMFTVLL